MESAMGAGVFGRAEPKFPISTFRRPNPQNVLTKVTGSVIDHLTA